jgi:hypothetical protein
MVPSPEGIGIYTNYSAPSPEGEGWDEGVRPLFDVISSFML